MNTLHPILTDLVLCMLVLRLCKLHQSETDDSLLCFMPMPEDMPCDWPTRRPSIHICSKQRLWVLKRRKQCNRVNLCTPLPMLILRTHLEAKIDKKEKMVFLLVYLCLWFFFLSIFASRWVLVFSSLASSVSSLAARYSTWLLIQLTPKGVSRFFCKRGFSCSIYKLSCAGMVQVPLYP